MNKEQLEALHRNLDAIETAVLGIAETTNESQKTLYPEDRTKKNEYYSKIGLVEAARIGKRIKDLKDNLKTIKAVYENLNTDFTQNLLPALVDDEGLQSPVRVNGVAKLVLSNDIYVQQQIKTEDDQRSFFGFLVDTGNSDIIKETVNSSSLKAVIKNLIDANNKLLQDPENKGKEIQEISNYTEIPGTVKVTPYTKVSYNKL